MNGPGMEGDVHLCLLVGRQKAGGREGSKVRSQGSNVKALPSSSFRLEPSPITTTFMVYRPLTLNGISSLYERASQGEKMMLTSWLAPGASTLDYIEVAGCSKRGRKSDCQGQLTTSRNGSTAGLKCERWRPTCSTDTTISAQDKQRPKMEQSLSCADHDASRRGIIGSLVQVKLKGHVLGIEQVDGGMGASPNQHLAKAEAGPVKGNPWLTYMSHNQHRHIQLVLWDLEPPK
ncbi:MAG: hypothetical protein FRX49_04146 [Trebouxia sp. A1-2]|nr:MAG: hypothetical protein FRX49_04146 [Trebouxia sp. A1-2]